MHAVPRWRARSLNTCPQKRSCITCLRNLIYWHDARALTRCAREREREMERERGTKAMAREKKSERREGKGVARKERERTPRQSTRNLSTGRGFVGVIAATCTGHDCESTGRSSRMRPRVCFCGTESSLLTRYANFSRLTPRKFR